MVGVLGVAGVLLSAFLGLAFGAEPLPLTKVWAVLAYQFGGPQPDPTALTIVWGLRLPRTILAATVGAGLAVAGAAMQTLVRNPLADPYLLGVSSGASVGATAVIALGVGGATGRLSLTAGALLGALMATALVFGVTQLQGGLTPLRMLLTGTVLASAMSSVSSLLIFLSGEPQTAQAVLFWLLGTVAGATWETLWFPLIGAALGLTAFLLVSAWMDALANGPDVAAGLGVPVARLRWSLFVIQAVLVGVLVASAGSIGFVGLIIPHICRLLVGSAHRRVFPISALMGAIFLVWVDVVARVLVAPVEIPLSVVTGIVGAPIFLFLLGRRSYSFGGGR
ncbi:MAG: iron ABC transporter permease [Propioniciclava sp.]|uniref:FecCD family ABC transporter permease n=1 Tax=Propioniciclava sp. TaxID=2038686 RepID=UPI0039E2B157